MFFKKTSTTKHQSEENIEDIHRNPTFYRCNDLSPSLFLLVRICAPAPPVCPQQSRCHQGWSVLHPPVRWTWHGGFRWMDGLQIWLKTWWNKLILMVIIWLLYGYYMVNDTINIYDNHRIYLWLSYIIIIMDIYIYIMDLWWISGWWFQPSWKIWKSMGRIIPYIMENMFETTNQY
jgi:hypothetical protein